MSKAIMRMYEKSGVPKPKGGGKGIHTRKFHKVAIAIKKSNPEYSMSRAYRIAMSRIGRNKAVKRSHWRS